MTIRYDGKEGFTAVAKFFDIDKQTACHLFDPDRYWGESKSKTAVARRIREVVETEKRGNDRRVSRYDDD